MLKAFKLRKWQSLFFSNIFFRTKCALFFLKIEEKSNIDD